MCQAGRMTEKQHCLKSAAIATRGQRQRRTTKLRSPTPTTVMHLPRTHSATCENTAVFGRRENHTGILWEMARDDLGRRRSHSCRGRRQWRKKKPRSSQPTTGMHLHGYILQHAKMLQFRSPRNCSEPHRSVSPKRSREKAEPETQRSAALALILENQRSATVTLSHTTL